MGAQYVIGENGERVSVTLPVEAYERMVEELEDAEDARAVDEVRAAVARGEDEFIPYEQARERAAKKCCRLSVPRRSISVWRRSLRRSTIGWTLRSWPLRITRVRRAARGSEAGKNGEFGLESTASSTR